MRNKKFLCCKRAIDTIPSIVLLFFMILALTGLIVVFSNMESNFQTMHKEDITKAQEKISLKTNIADEKITSVTIKNEGTTEVTIRSIYQLQDETLILLGDPSKDSQTFQTLHDHLAPGKTITIFFQEEKQPSHQATLIAATQRGTKSFTNQLSSTQPQDTYTYNPTELYVGPLILSFKDFYFQETTNGVIDPAKWQPAAQISSNKKCAFMIRVTNIDSKDIIINRYSGLTPLAKEFSTVKTWYIDPTESETLTHTLKVKEPTNITFIWDAPKNWPETGTNTPQQYYSPRSTSAIFLTFFGSFIEEDGTLTPYAQTIPFQAVVKT
jgi:archaellum component FlaF (FlaF/FlaG flagellin family)